MKGWLLDTNVISEPLRTRPSTRVLAFVAAQPRTSLFISVVSFAEIRFGVALLSDHSRRNSILDWLNFELRPRFAENVIAVDEEILVRWRLLIEEGRRRGYTFSEPDGLLAAQAAREDFVIVTRNVTDFLEAQVAVFNPWLGQFVSPSGQTMTIADLTDPSLLSRL